jgi:spore coat polysaccharide biosynthesis protein SpsF
MTKSHVVAIIQARMASSRLPGKVLLDIDGEPMLAHVVARTQLASLVDRVAIATTSERGDDRVAEFCTTQGYLCYRGSQYDVLDRYYQAARQFGADVIVRITADCPLLDPELVDRTIAYFLGTTGKQSPYTPTPDCPFPWDFAANRLPPPWGRTYPIGLDTEVCSFQALERAWREASQPHQREHVMPYLYEYSPVADSRHLAAYTPPAASNPHHPQFRALLVNHTEDFGTLRWTVDTAADLELVRRIFTHFHPRRDFTWLEVLEYYQSEPALAQINADIQHKKLFDIDEQSTLNQ